MNQVLKKRLFWLAVQFLIAGIGIVLVLTSLNQSLNLYLTPSQIDIKALDSNKIFRVGGLVKKHSIIKNGVQTQFVITDLKKELNVIYNGLLPGLFEEGKGVIVGGHFNYNTFVANEVLAKHDENYQPPGLNT